ncbi:leucine-rich repeat-containing protein 24-like [Harmonia axyridis]|uniref:leucine-rich repeat-containing protein 24-like n=1 Tax=Harmonia axyridis TaxID=115357 RepID=UPI001E275749|nr:leucine-rich repeat-containing protein 24-like [Harmonia axyridis]
MAVIFVVLLMITLASASPDWTDCQLPCVCKWSGGKRSAVCKSGGLTSVPNSLDSDLQVLYLSQNHIKYLPKDAFKNAGLMNLQRIYLIKNGLLELNQDAFNELLILIEIDLSHNALTSLHPLTFHGNERLKVLFLSGNPLTQLIEKQFPPLPHLRILDLEGCRIEYIHKDAFVNLGSLESLNLKYNLLKNVSETTFMNFAHLKTLQLDGNPWRCDCELRGFRNWFLASNLHSTSLSCSEPDFLYERHWENVNSEEFACLPQVAVSPQNEVQAEAGGNVTFGCHIQGDPEPQVWWLYEGYPINHTWIVIEAEEGLLDKWANISIFNVSDADVGVYTCMAKNVLDTVVQNVSLVLPEVATATTVIKSDVGFVWWTMVVVGVAVGFSAFCTMIAVYCARSSRRRGHDIKASVSFTDQEKKLLDVSIATTTDRGTGSCEGLGPEVDLVDPPVLITIEREPLPMTVFPPPPEFSGNILPVAPYGNIFISVSLSRDHHEPSQRQGPDLLDLSHRSKMVYHGMATLPRRQNPIAQYDNMGPRVTACGSSTLSLPDSTMDEVTPTPMPSSCVPLNPEFVSL